jgi:hypothetical protein
VLKFATAQIIAASLGDQERLTKGAHRAIFQYEARPGYLYVRSRAISSRCNDNFDEFPAEEIEKAYRTFVGKPVFVNHVNDNHRRARGVIIDAALHQDKNPDGTPDTWAEVLMEIDAVRFPRLAKAILAGDVDRTSMGCDVERSVCSVCNNEARTPADYCSHIPTLKGKRIYRAGTVGKKVGELVRETCFGLRFFENSVLVEPPADPTAHFLGVDSTGLGKAAAVQRHANDQLGLFNEPAGTHLDLYHHANGENAASIMRGRAFHPGLNDDPENAGRVYFSNRPHQEAGDHGDVAVHVHVPADLARPEGNPFPSGEQYYTVHPGDIRPEHIVGFRYPDKTAAIDYSAFEDPRDGLEKEDDGEDTAPAPTMHPAQTSQPTAPHVPYDGTTHDRQRRQDAVTHAQPFTPLKPSLNTLQTTASRKTAAQGLSWDDIGARHPHIYGDAEIHGEAAEHADGEMIGSAANDLAHSHPDDPDAENHHVSELTFHRAMVDPHTIDHKRHESGDGRVASAVEGYRKNPEQMPPLVLVHRHGVFQVADGHHRAEAAKAVGMDKVPAYVTKSPYPNKPDGWGERGPFHGAEKTRWTPPKTAPAAQAPQWEQQKLFGKQRKTAGPQYANPGEHPWFQQTGLSHEHVLNHWDQATSEEKAQGARWYPDAHHVAKAIAKLHPDITDDHEAAHKGAGVLSAYSPQQNWWANQHNAARSFVTGKAVGKGEGLMVMGSHASAAQKIMDGEDHQKVLKGPKTQDFAHLIEHAGNDEHGQPSNRVVMDRHALSVAAGRRLNADDAKGFPSSNRHYYEHAAEHFRRAAAVLSDREGRHVPPHEVQAVTWLTRQRLNASEDENSAGGKGRQTVQRNQRQQWKDLAGEHTPQLKEQDNSHVAKVVDAMLINDDGTIRTEAYGEIKAPADVDTLREENCPVCGDKDTFDGIQCQICGFISPPEQFRDPDLDRAKTMDLRKQIVDPSLVDNNGELQRVNDDGTGMPQQDGQPGDEQQLGPDGQPLNQDDPQVLDADQLDENGLPPSPLGDQALDGTQQDGPAVSDRNGDGIIQPDEIDPEGNVNAQQDMTDPEQGGQAAPRELPYSAQDHTGDPFTPGPDMPYRPDQPEGPNGKLDQDDAPYGRMPEPMAGQPGDGIADLFCPSCGFGADATPPQTQDMGNPGAAADGVVDGDVCPNCQRAQLLTPGEINSNYSKAPAVEKPGWN